MVGWVQLRSVAGSLSALIVLAGCAVNGPGQSVGEQRALPDLRDQAARAQLDQGLRARGWLPLGHSAGPGGPEPELFYIKPATIRRQGEVVTVPHFTVLNAQQSAAKSIAAYSSVREYNCASRNWRTVQAQAFADRLGTLTSAKKIDVDAAPSTLVPGSLGQRVYAMVCEGSASGSGVVVGSARVLTNSHVVNNCRKLEASVAGKKYPASIIAQDRQNDLALLQAEGLTDVGGGFKLRKTPVIGESVMVAGFPLASVLGNDLSVTSGMVNSVNGAGGDSGKFQLQAPVQPGNSGGPVLDRSANLLGLVVARLESVGPTAVQNVNFAIRPEIIKLFLAAQQQGIEETDVGTRLENEMLAERARKISARIDCSQRILGTDR